MPSKESDLCDRRERERLTFAALEESRRGRDRIRDRADVPPPDGRGPDTPNCGIGGRS